MEWYLITNFIGKIWREADDILKIGSDVKWMKWNEREVEMIWNADAYILHTHTLILISLLSNSEIKFCKKYFSLKLDPLLCCNFLSHHHHSNINIFVGGKWNYIRKYIFISSFPGLTYVISLHLEVF